MLDDFRPQTSSLSLFVHASVLQSTECWTLTCPIPASLSFTVPVLCTKNENYRESFCLYGGHTSRQISLPSFFWRGVHDSLCLKIDLLYCRTRMKSIPPWGQIWFCVAFCFGLALLLVALFTHTQSQLNLKVRLSVSQWTDYHINPLYLHSESSEGVTIEIHEIILVFTVITCSCVAFD